MLLCHVDFWLYTSREDRYSLCHLFTVACVAVMSSVTHIEVVTGLLFGQTPDIYPPTHTTILSHSATLSNNTHIGGDHSHNNKNTCSCDKMQWICIVMLISDSMWVLHNKRWIYFNSVTIDNDFLFTAL